MARTKSPQRIRLDGRLELELPDGNVVAVRPGPYGKGVAVVPVPAQGSGGGPGRGGRKPRMSTVRLRGRLAKDAAAGGLQKPRAYVEWLLGIDPDLSLASARQIVYRECKAVKGK